MADDDRLNRIEETLTRFDRKLDEITTAMIAIARTEEKLVSIEKNYYLSYERQNRMAQKLDSVEKQAIESDRAAKIATRLFWTLIGSLVAAATAMRIGFL